MQRFHAPHRTSISHGTRKDPREAEDEESSRAARSQPRDFIARSILLTPRKYELLYLDVRSISLVHAAVSLFYLRIKKQSRGSTVWIFFITLAAHDVRRAKVNFVFQHPSYCLCRQRAYAFVMDGRRKSPAYFTKGPPLARDSSDTPPTNIARDVSHLFSEFSTQKFKSIYRLVNMRKNFTSKSNFSNWKFCHKLVNHPHLFLTTRISR